MRILYGAVGKGLGHATRSGVVAEHLIARGHQVKTVASGRAYPDLAERLPGVEEIWGFSLALADGHVDTWQTILENVRDEKGGVPANWEHGTAIEATERILTRRQGLGMRFVTIPELTEATGFVVEPVPADPSSQAV